MKKIISTNNAPSAIGPYNQAILVNNTLYISGQLGIDPKTKDFRSGIKDQTEQSISNIKAILKEAGMSIDNVVKTTCFLADMSDFIEMNEVYESHFSFSPPARSTVAVKTLPKNGLIEIEVIAIKY